MPWPNDDNSDYNMISGAMDNSELDLPRFLERLFKEDRIQISILSAFGKYCFFNKVEGTEYKGASVVFNKDHCVFSACDLKIKVPYFHYANNVALVDFGDRVLNCTGYMGKFTNYADTSMMEDAKLFSAEVKIEDLVRYILTNYFNEKWKGKNNAKYV
jgi:hypothetical protein